MTEQTDAAEVEELGDQLMRWERGHDGANETDHWADRLARALLASDWLAAREAAAYQRGRDGEFNERLSFGIESGALDKYTLAAAEARGAERALREAADDLAQGRLGIDFTEVAEELEARAAAAATGGAE